MILTDKELHLLMCMARREALRAGSIIAKAYKKQVKVLSKSGGSSLASQVLTEVDLKSQKNILKGLSRTCSMYDIGILSEEQEDDRSRFEKEFFWSIDPLDGTLPFIEGTDGFSVSIALVSKIGEPVIGIIYEPLSKTLYHAIKGKGAFKNGKPWKLDSPSNTYITLVCDRSFLASKEYEPTVTKLKNQSTEVRVISHGGAATNAMWVLENSPAVYLKYPKLEDGGGSLWDYAASACIFNEIGAFASDINGGPLDLNRKDSTFMNHRGILFQSTKIF